VNNFIGVFVMPYFSNFFIGSSALPKSPYSSYPGYLALKTQYLTQLDSSADMFAKHPLKSLLETYNYPTSVDNSNIYYIKSLRRDVEILNSMLLIAEIMSSDEKWSEDDKAKAKVDKYLADLKAWTGTTTNGASTNQTILYTALLITLNMLLVCFFTSVFVSLMLLLGVLTLDNIFLGILLALCGLTVIWGPIKSLAKEVDYLYDYSDNQNLTALGKDFIDLVNAEVQKKEVSNISTNGV
jgi:hypothetical protein